LTDVDNDVFCSYLARPIGQSLDEREAALAKRLRGKLKYFQRIPANVVKLNVLTKAKSPVAPS